MRKNVNSATNEMLSFYRDQLFAKHILVSDDTVNTANIDNAVLVCYKLANEYGVVIKRGEEYADKMVLGYVMEKIGGKHVDKTFYRGFPNSVLRLSSEQLLIDQLIHYAYTYGLGNFDGEASHSVFEEEVIRTALKEKTDKQEFEIVDWDKAYKCIGEMVENTLASTRPLNPAQMQLINYAYVDNKFEDKIFKEVKAKNTAIQLLLEHRDTIFAHTLSASDILKVVEQLWNSGKYMDTNRRSKHTLNNLNLNNQDRKFIAMLLDKKLENINSAEIIACSERKKNWAGLLHHIHYKAKTDNARDFVNTMRGNHNVSALSAIEKFINEGKIELAIITAKRYKGSGYIVRNLNYFLSRCVTEKDIDAVFNGIDNFNPIIAMQYLINFSFDDDEKTQRNFTFFKYNRMITHRETTEEANRRKSFVSAQVKKKTVAFINTFLTNYYSGKLGGRIYIDPAMEKVALPIYLTAGETGYGILPTGSRVPLNSKNVRVFTYWEQVNDIDLSCVGINKDGSTIEFSWRSMWNRQSNGITFSGDITNGFRGASEYFDINLEIFKSLYPNVEYLVFNNNVYSSVPFKNVVCTAGFMKRQDLSSGRVYEPKTVNTSYKITCDSTYAHLFALDMNTNEMIWLNMADDNNFTVAGNTSKVLKKYFEIAKVLNYKTLFTNLATEIVEDYKDADVIVTDRVFEETEYADKTIHSYDIDKVIALMNGKFDILDNVTETDAE